MAVPSNTTAANAIVVITLPFTANQDVFDAGTAYSVWYKYTPTVAGMYGFWGFGGTIGAGYQPRVQLYGPDDPSILLYANSGGNKPVQFYLTENKVYYIKFVTNNATITPANLAISILKHDIRPYNNGDLFIPDDNPDYPATIISQVDGLPSKYIQPFSTNEESDVLDNGIFMTGDKNDNIPKIYKPDLTLVATVFGINYPSSIACDTVDTFYSTDNSVVTNVRVWKIKSDGTVIGTVASINLTGTGGGMNGISVSPDESILYYKVYPGSEANKIKRHNILTNTPMSDLVTIPIAGYAQGNRETLCLKDGTIINGYNSLPLVRTDYKIIRYNPDGTTANTYGPFAGVLSGSTLRFCNAIDNPNSFWAWISDSNSGTSVFKNIKTSDGTVLKSLSGHQYEVGEYQGTLVVNPIRFGHSESCAMLILRIPTPPDSSGIFFVNPDLTHDNYYEGAKKIPNPIIRTAIIGE